MNQNKIAQNSTAVLEGVKGDLQKTETLFWLHFQSWLLLSHTDCSTAIKHPSDNQNECWQDFSISSSYTLQPQEFFPITQLESNRPWKGQIPVFFTNRWCWIDLKCHIQDNAHLDWIRFFICLLSYVSIFLSTGTPQNHKLTKRQKKK